ncbi:hypothetical protein ACWGIV_22645 [Streptomyces sp. NPDC054844]
MWTELSRPVSAGAEPVGHVRLGHARTSTARHEARPDTMGRARAQAVASQLPAGERELARHLQRFAA